ncbi:ribosome assembly cofactor RimP [Spiroplasma cantharicola]|uniref:Ribosome maturation factor RimP n=1 Tax=Spiroplasma cantharicola TaxID=362837 RepID=A0A0M5KCH5_9MOLU|nr:ribosome assembly cofactor RimP [Spiroplasma cantharicola]ALD66643.1 ribosome maturation factor RimP [Spiroplasma cantharicola]
MSLDIIKNNYLEKIKNILNECDFLLYELNVVNDFDSKVLQILVENRDISKKNIDFDLLIKANESISNMLDDIDDLEDSYILEVASAGAERKVKSFEILKYNIGSFFYITLKKPIEIFTEFSATLTEIKDDELIFNFFIKGRPKKVKLKWDDIEFIRFAVKF